MRALALMLAFAGGCATKINQAVIGVATNLSAPAQLDGLTLQATRGNAIVAGQSWTLATLSSPPAPDGTRPMLPGSIVLYTTGTLLPQVDVTLTGTLGGNPVLTRRARFVLRGEQTRFLRMALESSCLNVSCPDEQTCIEGACQPIDVDLALALPYVDGQEYSIACDDPGFLSTFDGTPLPPPTTSCKPTQICQEGTCYDLPGAPPETFPGDFGSSSLGAFSVE